MYILLYGAKKNVGDFLILDRAIKLLRRHKPNRELFKVKRWLPIDEYIDKINQSKAVILCGGPAYQKDTYPGIYPLTQNLFDIRVPIIPFGLGWFSDYPEQDPLYFRFNNTSYLFIEKIHREIPLSSVRDIYTEWILRNHGIHNVIMTGCPAWYELDYINNQFQPMRNVTKIVVTTAQNRRFHPQNIELLRRVAIMFKNAKRFCVFHRGIWSDAETPKSEEQDLLKIKSAADELGYEVIDASYDVSKIDFYKQCDLHIGYRVHAHIYFLSIRKPSFLLNEDGRGRGFSASINMNIDVNAYHPEALDILMEKVTNEARSCYTSFIGLDKVFQTYYQNMVSFIQSLP